jgi:hypothetical protein
MPKQDRTSGPWLHAIGRGVYFLFFPGNQKHLI